MGYLKVSRELLNSSFWRSLAPAEKGILIDLMAMAAYKPTSINLGGVKIHVQPYELSFFANSISEHLGISINRFRSFIDKLTTANLCTKEIRKMRINDPNCKSNCKSNYKSNCKKTQHYTCLSFHQSVFSGSDKEGATEADQTANQTTFHTANHEHNKEVINKEVLNESTRRNSACAVPVSNGSKGKEYRKPWYTMEQIAKMELPYAEEIMKEWTEYSGRSKNDVLALLQKFTKNQRLFGLPEMTLDVFNKEFRKEMKSAFALRSKYKNEPVQKIRYLGEDD